MVQYTGCAMASGKVKMPRFGPFRIHQLLYLKYSNSVENGRFSLKMDDSNYRKLIILNESGRFKAAKMIDFRKRTLRKPGLVNIKTVTELQRRLIFPFRFVHFHFDSIFIKIFVIN